MSPQAAIHREGAKTAKKSEGRIILGIANGKNFYHGITRSEWSKFIKFGLALCGSDFGRVFCRFLNIYFIYFAPSRLTKVLGLVCP